MDGILAPEEWSALTLSLKVAVWSMAATLPFAVGAAWLLARCRFPGKSLVDALIHLPLVLPPTVIGYLLLIGLGRRSAFGTWLHEQFGIVLPFTWQGAAVAAGVMAFPLMVRAIRLSILAVDPRLEQAARTLGAGRFSVFRTVTLPLAAPGVLAGLVLGFARSLGEFGATITFAANIPGQTRTLPLALYTLTQAPGGEAAALRLCIVSIALALAALMASEALARRMAAP